MPMEPLEMEPLEMENFSPMFPVGSSGFPSSREPERFQPISPVGEQKLRIMPKIAAYREKGYLNDEQERDLYTDLQQHKQNPFDNSTVQEVERKLEEFKTFSEPVLRDLFQQENTQIRIGNDQNKRLEWQQNGVAKRLYQEDPEEEPEQKEEEEIVKPRLSYKETPLNDRVILDSGDIMDQAPEDFLEHLFVEMCFFARLGFIQPPTCLRCLYMEAIEGMDEDLNCTTFCTWRRNANEALHPDALDGNLCLVECQAARKLINGEEVQDHYWDHIKRQFVLMEK